MKIEAETNMNARENSPWCITFEAGGILRLGPLSCPRCGCGKLLPWGSSPAEGAGLTPAITGPACAGVLEYWEAGGHWAGGACCCNRGLGWRAKGKEGPVCLWTSWLSTREGSGCKPNSPEKTQKAFAEQVTDTDASTHCGWATYDWIVRSERGCWNLKSSCPSWRKRVEIQMLPNLAVDR